MPIRLETDGAGRRVLLTVTDDRRSAAALADLLAALRWTKVDEVVVDLRQLDTIDMRVAEVLARAVRHQGETGRHIALVCAGSPVTHALHAVGLDGTGTVCGSLADAGWCAPNATHEVRKRRHQAGATRAGSSRARATSSV
ncbi:MAG TPA: STAS domain-containing protein [Actinomycetales bacterium]|nr:STAS domain-containing protein [Actinomycetales bacterium]